MQKSLLRSIFFLKKTYSKHFIYAKQLITIYFKKNSLFKTVYLCKRAYYNLF